jgi:hypothetical protein
MVPRGTGPGDIMIDEKGSFRINVEIENPARPGDRRIFQSILIDTGAELSVFPAAALESLHIGRLKELHFRQARSLEGLNVRIDPVSIRRTPRTLVK